MPYLHQIVDHLDALGGSASSPPVLTRFLGELAPLPLLQPYARVVLRPPVGLHQVKRWRSLGNLDSHGPLRLSMREVR